MTYYTFVKNSNEIVFVNSGPPVTDRAGPCPVPFLVQKSVNPFTYSAMVASVSTSGFHDRSSVAMGEQLAGLEGDKSYLVGVHPDVQSVFIAVKPSATLAEKSGKREDKDGLPRTAHRDQDSYFTRVSSRNRTRLSVGETQTKDSAEKKSDTAKKGHKKLLPIIQYMTRWPLETRNSS